MTPEEAMQRLVEIRTEIERHETSVWLLAREADTLRYEIAATQAKSKVAA